MSITITKKLSPMEKARARISSNQVFFAALVLSTPFKVRNDIPTAATDMTNVYYNESFVEALTPEQLIGLIIHEIMHIMLKHGLRRGSREPRLWNIAADHVINLKLLEMNFQLPQLPGVCKDPRFKGMHAEEVYSLLLEEKKKCKKKKPEPGQGPKGPKQPGGEPDEDGDPSDKSKPGSEMGQDLLEPDKSPEGRRAIEAGIDQKVAKAVAIAKSRGVLPGELAVMLDEYFDAQVPWQAVLKRFASKFVRSSSSWRVRNRRHHSMYLPGKRGKVLGEAIIIGDTSGSMWDKPVFEAMSSEINGIIKDVKPELTRVIWADDTAVANEEVFKPNDTIVLHPKGGGGTDMRKPLEYVKKYKPLFAILITDGETPWPVSLPYPLIICCTTSAQTPDWAMTVRVTV